MRNESFHFIRTVFRLQINRIKRLSEMSVERHTPRAVFIELQGILYAQLTVTVIGWRLIRLYGYSIVFLRKYYQETCSS